MKAEILKMLRETGDYVSGQEICEKFGVSRTAVWKVIRQLQEEGYQVEAVRSKGYRILDEPDVITAEEVASLMETEWAGKPVVYYPETDSTNIRIRHLGDRDNIGALLDLIRNEFIIPGICVGHSCFAICIQLQAVCPSAVCHCI